MKNGGLSGPPFWFRIYFLRRSASVSKKESSFRHHDLLLLAEMGILLERLVEHPLRHLGKGGFS